MMKTTVLIAVALLTTACAGAGRIQVRPGTDMALPSPPPSAGAEVAGAGACVLTKVFGAAGGDGYTCPQPSDSLRPGPRPLITPGKPQMRVRTTTSVFRRG